MTTANTAVRARTQPPAALPRQKLSLGGTKREPKHEASPAHAKTPKKMRPKLPQEPRFATIHEPWQPGSGRPTKAEMKAYLRRAVIGNVVIRCSDRAMLRTLIRDVSLSNVARFVGVGLLAEVSITPSNGELPFRARSQMPGATEFAEALGIDADDVAKGLAELLAANIVVIGEQCGGCVFWRNGWLIKALKVGEIEPSMTSATKDMVTPGEAAQTVKGGDVDG